MRLRRPHYLVFEPRERVESSLHRLVAGSVGAAMEWVAWAPHLVRECTVEADDLAVFEALAPGEIVGIEALAARFGESRIARLVEAGLLIGPHPAHAGLAARDARLRDAAWWGPAALAQVFGRWEGIDIAAIEREEGPRTVQRLIQERGIPPTEAWSLGDDAERVPLPAPRPSPLDALLQARVTCRNFDPDAGVPLPQLASVLHRVFGAQAVQALAPGAAMLKKNSPSGGALHPIEAFVLAQRVEGLAPGLYHYHCVEHALEPIARLDPADAAAAAHELVAGQSWFAHAPVMVLMAARFPRNYWKYPGHAKAWKVVQLDAGHLSQNLYLATTELGLGAFVTGAINDASAERLFGLDGLDIGPVAVNGFGSRLPDGAVRELDPLDRRPR